MRSNAETVAYRWRDQPAAQAAAAALGQRLFVVQPACPRRRRPGGGRGRAVRRRAPSSSAQPESPSTEDQPASNSSDDLGEHPRRSGYRAAPLRRSFNVIQLEVGATRHRSHCPRRSALPAPVAEVERARKRPTEPLAGSARPVSRARSCLAGRLVSCAAASLHRRTVTGGRLAGCIARQRRPRRGGCVARAANASRRPQLVFSPLFGALP